MRVAAVLFIPLLLGLTYMLFRMNQRTDGTGVFRTIEKVVAKFLVG